MFRRSLGFAGANELPGIAKAVMTPAISALIPPCNKKYHNKTKSDMYTLIFVTFFLHAANISPDTTTARKTYSLIKVFEKKIAIDQYSSKVINSS